MGRTYRLVVTDGKLFDSLEREYALRGLTTYRIPIPPKLSYDAFVGEANAIPKRIEYDEWERVMLEGGQIAWAKR